MRNINAVQAYLGDPYTISCIDHEDVIYRKLNNGFEFEISVGRTYTVYVWSDSPKQIIGIYNGINGLDTLKDVLGHLAFKYQNLISQIQVEREG